MTTYFPSLVQALQLAYTNDCKVWFIYVLSHNVTSILNKEQSHGYGGPGNHK